MRELLRPALSLLLVLTLLTGFLYPLLATIISVPVFTHQAQGSLVKKGEVIVGSELIGQEFSDPRYFWGRPSATSPCPYNAQASSGSNLGPTNPARRQGVESRVARLRDIDPTNTQVIPIDLVTSSASGLDPDISPAAAAYQTPRIARIRNLPVQAVRDLVVKHTTERHWGVFGEPRVNVLHLNLALDAVRN